MVCCKQERKRIQSVITTPQSVTSLTTAEIARARVLYEVRMEFSVQHSFTERMIVILRSKQNEQQPQGSLPKILMGTL